MVDDRLREALAEYAHEAWAGWMQYLFSKTVEKYGFARIPPALTKRWTRQMNTPYADLSPNEKESDREEADKILAIMRGPEGNMA